MPSAIHRTAVFLLPEPTRHVAAALDRAFAAYGDAYAELLYVAYLRYGRDDDLAAGRTAGLDALRGLATYAMDERTSMPRMSARTLTQRLYAGEQLPARAGAALSRLPSRLRQSAREHAGQSLMSYLALADEWLASPASERRGRMGGPPGFPQVARAGSTPQRGRAAILADLACLADDRRRERALVAELLTADRMERQRSVAIPFVGVADDYGCGLYYRADTDAFYARLDVLAPGMRAARALAMPGVYTSVKTGERWASEAERQRRAAAGEDVAGLRSFGRRTGMLWVPILLDEATNPHQPSYHERALRFTRAAFLPQRHADGTRPTAAEPVAAKLVRRALSAKWVQYELHASFEIPADAVDADAAGAGDGKRRDDRPILAINRGLRHLYSAVLLTPDATAEITAFAADGRVLLERQAAMERVRRAHQRVGRAPGLRWTVRDRRQARIADGEIAVCANQIVEVARRAGAQVVMEQLGSFARGAAVRAVPGHPVSPRTRQAAFRALLGRRQFEALRHAVDARLELVGLPPAATVSAAWISRICTRCGTRDVRTFAERERAAATTGNAATTPWWEFVCPACGARRDVDETAAVNVGRKLAWLRQRRVARASQKPGEGSGGSEATPAAQSDWETFVRALAVRANV